MLAKCYSSEPQLFFYFDLNKLILASIKVRDLPEMSKNTASLTKNPKHHKFDVNIIEYNCQGQNLVFLSRF